MSRFFRDLFRLYYQTWLGMLIALLLFGFPASTVFTFITLLGAGKTTEAPMALFNVFLSCGVVGFIVWVHHDATQTSERLEQRAKKLAELAAKDKDQKAENSSDSSRNVIGRQTQAEDRFQPRPER